MTNVTAEADAWWLTHAATVQDLVSRRLHDPLFQVFVPGAAVPVSRQPLGIERGWISAGSSSPAEAQTLDVEPLREFRSCAAISPGVFRRPDSTSPVFAAEALADSVNGLLSDVRSYLLEQINVPDAHQPRAIDKVLEDMVTRWDVPPRAARVFVVTTSRSLLTKANALIKSGDALTDGEAIHVTGNLVAGRKNSALLILQAVELPRLVQVDLPPAVLTAGAQGLEGFLRMRLVAAPSDATTHAYSW